MANDCTIRSVARLLHTHYERVAADLEFDGVNPPDIHQIIDYLLNEDIALTPIMRRPVSIHKGAQISRFSPEDAEARFFAYGQKTMGLAMGLVGEIGHMAFYSMGTIYDGEMNQSKVFMIDSALKHGFDLHTFMVASWLT